MANCNLNTLDPMKFQGLIPMRMAAIADAPATPLPKTYADVEIEQNM